MSSNALWERWQAPRVAEAASSAQRPRSSNDVKTSPSHNTSVMSPAELAQIRQQAREEAWQQGLEEGRKAGQQELEKAANRWHHIMDELTQPLAQSSQQVGDELTLLALAIAKQVIKTEIKAQPKQIIELVSEALKALPSATKSIQVVLHPDDARVVKQALQTNTESSWKIEEDRQITVGGCVVKSDSARIDERVEARIERVVASLFGVE
ncbi:MAG: flagellar assembly protein FliH [Moraxellaceae bacterium]|nr:flagellar assembly protein FliH [Moraxellaceae bacterium]MDZ4387069.1 flagellar assembly protein FliH [Moraxellaceae bacterium]